MPKNPPVSQTGKPTTAELLEVYKQIGETERHFNSLEKDYRILASQWLLASLGVIGYLLQKDKPVMYDKNLLIGLIGIVSNIGIFLLWLIDLRVYHKLLNCAFLQGVQMEREHDWLPKIRTDMLMSQERGDVVLSTGLYYICSCMLLLTISVISLSAYFGGRMIPTLLIIGLGVVISFAQVAYMRAKGNNKRAERLFRHLKADYRDEVFLYQKPIQDRTF